MVRNSQHPALLVAVFLFLLGLIVPFVIYLRLAAVVVGQVEVNVSLTQRLKDIVAAQNKGYVGNPNLLSGDIIHLKPDNAQGKLNLYSVSANTTDASAKPILTSARFESEKGIPIDIEGDYIVIQEVFDSSSNVVVRLKLVQ